MTHIVLDHVWQSTFFAAAAGLLTLYFRENGAGTRYWLWFVASCKFLFPFSILSALGSRVNLKVAAAPIVSMHPILRDFAIPFSTAPSQPPIRFTPAVPSHGIDPQWIYIGIWLFGVTTVFVYWLVRWVRISAALKRSVPLSLAVPIPIRASSVVLEPGIVGFLRPVLLMPQGICERLQAQELDLILAHELAHYRRRDNLTAAVQMLASALCWFHPLVWWIGRRLTAEREAACDEAVIESGGDRETYAKALLSVCKFYLKMPLDCAPGVSGGHLSKRIQFIMTARPILRLSAARKALLAAAAVMTLIVPVALGAIVTADSNLAAFSVGLTGGAFQQVTLRQAQPGNGLPHDNVFPGRYSARNFSLRALVAFAFDGQDGLVLGPKSLDDRYDIQARAPGAFTASGYAAVEQAEGMVRRMLADRFGLEIHRGTQTVSALVLTASPAGARLQAARPDQDDGPFFAVRPNFIQCSMVRIGDFATVLSRSELGVPIIDQTGLTGTYNFKIAWNLPSGADTPAGTDSSMGSANGRAAALAEALESQLGLTLRLQRTTAPVLIVDRAAPPKDLLPAFKAVPLEPQDFDRYAGHYQFPGGSIMTVSRENEHYWTQLTGQERVEIFPDARGEFFTKVVGAEISFQSNAKGQTTGLVLHQDGLDIQAPRMDEVAAEKLLNALILRIENKIPIPGSRQALRRLILATASGQPNYEQMGPELAAATREQLHDIRRTLAGLGPLVSLKLTGVDPWGWDIYEAQFAHGRDEWRIDLETNGRVKGAWFGPTR